MKIVFFGTPYYVIPVLKTLDKYHDVVGVVTQPPKQVGRQKIKTFSAVDNYAHKKHIPIYFDFEDIPTADIGILASYGKIIPKNILNKFPLGILNIHPSLLPKFRGASPVQQNIIEDPQNVGATIIKLIQEVDAGPIITSFKDELLPEDTTQSLRDRLFERSAEVILEVLPVYEKGKIKPRPQNEKDAIYTKILCKQDGLVNLKKDSAELIYAKFRAYAPWPGIWTKIKMGTEEKRLKILKCHIDPNKLVLDEVQLEGKKPVAWKQFEMAYQNFKFIG